MKKISIIFCALVLSLNLNAQKKELKALKKAVESNSFSEAANLITTLEGLQANMKDKQKGEFNLYKAKTLLTVGSKTNDEAKIDEGLKSMNLAEKTKSKEVAEFKQQLIVAADKQSRDFYIGKKYKMAAKSYEYLYKLLPEDTTFLYNAAVSAVLAKENDMALPYYETLRDLGYTGITISYMATDKDGNDVDLGDKVNRDLLVKSPDYSNPRDVKQPSKRGEIIRNIAFILIEQGKTDEALKAINDAKSEYPKDVNLLISEANIYFKLGDKDKFAEITKKAISMDPTNASLYFNVGTSSMESGDYENAITYLQKSLELDATSISTAFNLNNTYIEMGNAIDEKMNKLGSSAADDRKYEEYQAEKTDLYKKAAGVLETFISKNPEVKNLSLYKQLRNIYGAIGETDKFKAMKEKVEGMEESGN